MWSSALNILHTSNIPGVPFPAVMQTVGAWAITLPWSSWASTRQCCTRVGGSWLLRCFLVSHQGCWTTRYAEGSILRQIPKASPHYIVCRLLCLSEGRLPMWAVVAQAIKVDLAASNKMPLPVALFLGAPSRIHCGHYFYSDDLIH